MEKVDDISENGRVNQIDFAIIEWFQLSQIDKWKDKNLEGEKLGDRKFLDRRKAINNYPLDNGNN